jgi:hypothetical protein
MLGLPLTTHVPLTGSEYTKLCKTLVYHSQQLHLVRTKDIILKNIHAKHASENEFEELIIGRQQKVHLPNSVKSLQKAQTTHKFMHKIRLEEFNVIIVKESLGTSFLVDMNHFPSIGSFY